MIVAYAHSDGRLVPLPDPGNLKLAIWIDMLSPDAAETAAIASAFGVELPTREDMDEIETSSRLYHEGETAFMTATLVAGADSDDPQMAPVTFVLTPERLITVRHHSPKPFETFPQRAQQAPIGCDTSEGAMLGLTDDIIDRIADVLERLGRDIESISRVIFRPSDAPESKQRNFQRILEDIGRKGDFVSKLRESLVSIDRVLGFLDQQTRLQDREGAAHGLIKTLSRDEQSLTQHADFLSEKVALLLQATLGMIGIEQNAIIKFFSVVAVVFLPPTLIASIYGMNFEFMPELDQRLGYPVALLLMLLSGILPYVFFKRRGWL